MDKKTREKIEREFRCGRYTFEQITSVYGLTCEEAIEIIKPALIDGNHAQVLLPELKNKQTV